MQGFGQSGDEAKSLVLVFPGQGTQHIGMGADVCDQVAVTARVWDCASDIAGFDVRKVCMKGPLPKLDKTAFQQVAVTTVNVATFESLRAHQPLAFNAVAGHSVGEFSALYAAGALGMEDVFRAVTARGRIMQALAEQQEGAMYAIKGVDNAMIAAFIEEHGFCSSVQIANDNSPRQQVISGERNALKALIPLLLKSGFEHVRLPVNGAWHSQLMRAGEYDFNAVLDGLSFASPQVPVFTNQAASAVVDPQSIRSDLAKNLYSTVRWRESIVQLAQLPAATLLEVGPKRVLGRMLSDFGSQVAGLVAIHADDILAPLRKASA